jgi:hypothetical protein
VSASSVPRSIVVVPSVTAAPSVPPEITSIERYGGRERFEGKHPFVCWCTGRDREIPVAGYAPSEYRLKPWPQEVLSGAWCPPCDGDEHTTGFELERLVPLNPSSSRSRTDATTGTSAGTGGSPFELPRETDQSPVARLAAGAREESCLDNSFLRSRRSPPSSRIARASQLISGVRRTARPRGCAAVVVL